MKKLLVPLLLILIVASSVSAVSLGVNKATMTFNDVLRGGYAENTVSATTDSDEALTVEHSFVGDIEEWATLIPGNDSEDVLFNATHPVKFRVIVEPPEDTAIGTYTGELRLLTGPFARTGGQFGSSIRASFAVRITVVVTGEQIVSCTSGGYNIVDTEIGDVFDFRATVRNTGNVRVTPTFNIDVWDQYQTRVIESFTVPTGIQVLPTTQQNFLDSVQNDLEIGQYWANINEETCGDASILTFNVLDIGGFSDRGDLLRIDNQPWADTDDIIRIAAVFKNSGTRTVNAKFKGTVEMDGKVIEVIDTDSLNVPPGEIADLETFFNPKQPGRYQVKGRVIYNEKLTFQKSSILTVQGEYITRASGGFIKRIFKNPYQASMIFIVVAIATMLILISRARRRRRTYHRRW